MTAALIEPDVVLPLPHANQRPILDAPQRFKLLNCGGRFGKSRLCLTAATVGHGPRDADGTPRWRGMAQGGDIAWVAPDFPQARAIWREEILPRFKGRRGVQVHEQDKRVSLPGGGTLEIRSAENIDSLRGHAWDGVIFDESSRFDLRYAWEEVVEVRLVDRRGWAIFPSTPNGGLDGNPDKVIPSYFNRLCDAALGQALPPDWGYWHYTTRDNPYLPTDEVERIYQSAPPGTMKRRQELDAELVLGGGGQAFPEFDPTWHIRSMHRQLLADWRWYAGLDWGYREPSAFTPIAVGPEGDIHVWYDWYWTGIDATEAGQRVADRIKRDALPLEFLIHDSAMLAVLGGGQSIAERFLTGLRATWRECPPFARCSKGKGSIGARIDLLHGLLAHGTDPANPKHRPLLTFSPHCTNLIRTLPRLVLDPRDGERLAEGQDDHGFDGLTYVLQARPQTPTIEQIQPVRDKAIFRWEDGSSPVRVGVPTMADEVHRRLDTGRRFQRGRGQRMEVEP